MKIGSRNSGYAGFESDLQDVENSLLGRRIKALADFPACRHEHGYNPAAQIPFQIPDRVSVFPLTATPGDGDGPRAKLLECFSSSIVGANAAKKHIFP
ncbi:hypothetical protein LMA00_27595 [Burkholderia ambifaria]|uniref:hypothetical protein n=1 Tax=Burkholderia ambifaria TaxID=152480 RepID=UPI001E430938|nr:hypothetical protein [Burkholderia ambifaria]UEP50755.1 hypothetical protein LMA00_27595 [Burkholderia ambifaria]